MLRKLLIILIITSTMMPLGLFAQNNKTNMDTISYSLGVLVASNLKNQGFDNLNSESFTKAVNDVLKGNALSIDVNQANQNITGYLKAESEKAGKIAIDKEKEFLAGNAKREGIRTTASGLQYEIIESGAGATPKASDKVTVHYTGTLIDGAEFDSSVKRGQPATFPVNGVIAGWTEALQLMQEGDKWRLYIPFALGYGERGAGESIPPFSTLIFDVELIKVN